MRIYEHKTTMLVSGGSISTVTLSIAGGLFRYMYVQTATSSTIFRANLKDEDGDSIMDWGFQTGSLRDGGFAVPVLGRHTFQITNASQTDTFKIKLRVEE